MPSQRSENQTLIAFAVDANLLAVIDAERGSLARSAWIRLALVKALTEAGYDVGHLAAAPDRAGKGGRPRKTST